MFAKAQVVLCQSILSAWSARIRLGHNVCQTILSELGLKRTLKPSVSRDSCVKLYSCQLNGLLATQERERVSNVPLRYKRSWTVRRVIELAEHQVDQYDRHCAIVDDTGKRLIYTSVEDLGADLNKHQVNALLGH